MNKSENTLLALEAALERIKQGKPKRIPAHRKLSVRAVEEEANLGNGSGYYYPDFVEKVKRTKIRVSLNVFPLTVNLV
jgi:replication-associated recombination protein RarA